MTNKKESADSTRYDFSLAEKEMQRFWEENAIYSFHPERTGEIYSIDTPPPTVSGMLHIGHIFSYTQAEMIARFKRMQGFNVFYPFGFDDNGLPTERLVEKEGNNIAKDLPRSEFINKCIASTSRYEAAFRELWQSMGFSVDWSLQYETINPEVQRISQRSFLKMAQDGKAYMKASPVLWCTECQTSIAQAELDTAEKTTTFCYIPFIADGETLLVATTRPELLFGCVCLFVHPEDERYTKFVGKTAITPLYGMQIPVLTDDSVEKDKGTGIVMCATFGDSTDVMWYEKHNLAYRKVVLPDGHMAGEVPLVGGMTVVAARRHIIGLLKESGLLIRSEEIMHTVAVHERCGRPVEIIPSSQWYIEVLSQKQKLLEAGESINWYPAYMKTRYRLWVENLKWDWNISRQRYFGVPIPVWYCNACGSIRLADESKLPVNPLETMPDTPCEKCGCSDFRPETSVFDTWATSSVTPLINAKWGTEKDMSDKLLPMSLRTQAHEIIRTWAFYTIVKSLYHTGEIPWKDIMISGFVMAKDGGKISKSKGNSDFEPATLIRTHSADVIRYWAANSRLGTDTFFSEDELGIARRFVTKLWNASKFAISHLKDIDETSAINEHGAACGALLPIDRWIVERCRQTTFAARRLFDQYEVGLARHEIDQFFWKDFCDNYLEIVKERLYQPDIHGTAGRHSAQCALYYCMLSILKLYAVYTPHITEFIYQQFFRQHEGTKSLHLLQWEKTSSVNEDILEFGEIVKSAIGEARRYKAENNLSMKAEMEALNIQAAGRFESMLCDTLPDLRACCRAGIINIHPES